MINNTFWLSTILLILCAIVGTLASIASVRLSHKLGILDQPGERKVHVKPVAYLGGFGFVLTMIIGVGIFGILQPYSGLMEFRSHLIFVVGLMAIFLIGLWDDVIGIRAIIKLFLQIAVAFGMWLAGVRIERVSLAFGQSLDLLGWDQQSLIIVILASLPSIIITVGWYVALMNAINLIDGLDGLAGGVSLIAALSLGIVGITISYTVGLNLGQALPIIASGAIFGFLTQNWHPAKTFMGDSGSLSIGFTLATASLISSTKAPALLALMVPLTALALPLFETAFSFLRRAIKGTNPFKADRRHLHHRLLDAGLDQRRVVLIFLYTTAYFGVNAVLISQSRSPLLLLNVAMIGLGLLMLIEYLKYFEKKRERESKQVKDSEKSNL